MVILVVVIVVMTLQKKIIQKSSNNNSSRQPKKISTKNNLQICLPNNLKILYKLNLINKQKILK